MDRDRRLTGYLRGQTDNPAAPPGFELNNPWRVRPFPYPLGPQDPSADILGSARSVSSKLALRFCCTYL